MGIAVIRVHKLVKMHHMGAEYPKIPLGLIFQYKISTLTCHISNWWGILVNLNIDDRFNKFKDVNLHFRSPWTRLHYKFKDDTHFTLLRIFCNMKSWQV